MCLSRFINIISGYAHKNTITNLSFKTDIADDCFFATFDLNNHRGSIFVECKSFACYIKDKGFKSPTVVEIDKQLREYIPNLTFQEFKQHLKN